MTIELRNSEHKQEVYYLLGLLIFVVPFPILAFIYSWYLMIKAPSKKLGPLIYVYCLFILAYSYEFSEFSNVDLVRYFKQLDIIENLDFLQASSYFNDGLITEQILFWVIAKLHLPHLLPAVTTATVYGVGVYITFNIASREQLKNSWKIILLQLVMIPFFSVVANIRNVFAFSLVILAVYRDTVKNKKNILTFLLYFMGIFMHKTGLVLVLLRLLIPLCRKAIYLIILVIFSLPLLINTAYKYVYLFSFGGKLGLLIRRLIFSSYHYLQGAEGTGALAQYAQRVNNSVGATLARFITLSFMLVIFGLYLAKYIKTKGLNDFQVFGYLLCVLTLACNVIDTPAYWRFAAATCLVLAPILYDLFDIKIIMKRNTYYIWSFLIVFFILRFGIALYSNRELFSSPILINILLTNAYTIFFQLIQSVFALL